MIFFAQNPPTIQSLEIKLSRLEDYIDVYSPQMRSYAGIYIYMPAYGLIEQKYICPHMKIYMPA